MGTAIGTRVFNLRTGSNRHGIPYGSGPSPSRAESDDLTKDPSGFLVHNGFAYMVLNTTAYGSELYRSNGTTVQLVADLHPTSGSSPNQLIELAGKIYFEANPGTSPRLYVTDGTATGTSEVAPGFADRRLSRRQGRKPLAGHGWLGRFGHRDRTVYHRRHRAGERAFCAICGRARGVRIRCICFSFAAC